MAEKEAKSRLHNKRKLTKKGKSNTNKDDNKIIKQAPPTLT